MKYMAFDLSLTGTGVAYGDTTATIKPKQRGVERLSVIRQALQSLVIVWQPRCVIIEGYSFGSRGNALFQIGELGGVVRLMLHDLGIPFIEVPPLQEAPLGLVLGAITRVETALRPVVRHFLTHLHRAAHHLQNDPSWTSWQRV